MLTCFLQRAEDYKTKCRQKCQKDEVDEEIPEEDVSAKSGPLVFEEADHQRVFQEVWAVILPLQRHIDEWKNTYIQINSLGLQVFLSVAQKKITGQAWASSTWLYLRVSICNAYGKSGACNVT